VIERIEVVGRVVMVGAYVAVCVGFLIVMFPGARLRLGSTWNHQVYAWRLGRRRVVPSSAWIALSRTDLPAEPAPER
jgi:hypothetical protein